MQHTYRALGVVVLRRVLDAKLLAVFRDECDYLASLTAPGDEAVDVKAASSGAGAAAGSGACDDATPRARPSRGPEWVVDMLEDVPVSCWLMLPYLWLWLVLVAGCSCSRQWCGQCAHRHCRFRASQAAVCGCSRHRCQLPPDSPARIQRLAYSKLRRACAQTKPGVEGVTESLLFDRLPALAALALGVRPSDMCLFNEHYIVKRPGSRVQFRWHRVGHGGSWVVVWCERALHPRVCWRPRSANHAAHCTPRACTGCGQAACNVSPR